MLADPDLVASSSLPGNVRRSRSRGRGETAGDRSRSRSSRLSPPRGRDSCEERRCARSRSRGARAWSRESRSRSTDVRVHMDKSALAVTRHSPLLPMCGLVAPSRSLLTATGTDGCACALGVTVRGRDDSARDRLAVARPSVTARGHTGPATGHMTAAGLVTALLLLTACGLGKRVGGLDGVTGTAQRLSLLPAVAATLG